MKKNGNSPILHIAGVARDGRLDIPLCFTPEAIETLIGQVGTRAPETGAKLFGPLHRFGVDHVEFDEKGSAASSSAIYIPDAEWGENRRRFWLEQNPPRVWTGDAHSHPGNMNRPSMKSGEAAGDLGYAEAVFAENPPMQIYAIPILTGTGGPEVTLHPWVTRRTDHGVELLSAEVRICPADEFPMREFNPQWERGRTPPERPLVQGAELAALVEGEVLLDSSVQPARLRVLQRGVLLTIELPTGFPAMPPTVLLPTVDGSRREVRLGWKRTKDTPVEERLAALVTSTVRLLARTR